MKLCILPLLFTIFANSFFAIPAASQERAEATRDELLFGAGAFVSNYGYDYKKAYSQALTYEGIGRSCSNLDWLSFRQAELLVNYYSDMAPEIAEFSRQDKHRLYQSVIDDINWSIDFFNSPQGANEIPSLCNEAWSFVEAFVRTAKDS